MLNYQIQNSQQTLADGIAEFYAVHAKQIGARKLTPEAEEFFRCHDVAHVVFGCDVSLSNEIIVKISSLFGTSAGVSVLKGYRLAESKEVYEKLRIRHVLVTAIRSLYLVPRTLFRCARMTRRWPWDSFDSYLDKRLEFIRKEFGVTVSK